MASSFTDGTAVPVTQGRALQWYACRIKPPQNPGRKTVQFGARLSGCKGRDGKVRYRREKGSGPRQFVHEVILQRAGFQVFQPVRQEWRRLNRYSREKQLQVYPLLVGWCFVGWPVDQCRWADLHATGMVVDVFGAGLAPARIRSQTIAQLMERWGAGRVAPDLQRFMRTHCEFDIGDETTMIDGMFTGCGITVTGVDGPRVKGLIELLGRTIEIEADAYDLAPKR